MSGKKGMHRMGRPRKFDIRKEDLERLRKAGWGRTLIAKVYGCDQTTIRHWLIKYGLPTELPLIEPKPHRMKRLLARHVE